MTDNPLDQSQKELAVIDLETKLYDARKQRAIHLLRGMISNGVKLSDDMIESRAAFAAQMGLDPVSEVQSLVDADGKLMGHSMALTGYLRKAQEAAGKGNEPDFEFFAMDKVPAGVIYGFECHMTLPQDKREWTRNLIQLGKDLKEALGKEPTFQELISIGGKPRVAIGIGMVYAGELNERKDRGFNPIERAKKRAKRNAMTQRFPVNTPVYDFEDRAFDIEAQFTEIHKEEEEKAAFQEYVHRPDVSRKIDEALGITESKTEIAAKLARAQAASPEATLIESTAGEVRITKEPLMTGLSPAQDALQTAAMLKTMEQNTALAFGVDAAALSGEKQPLDASEELAYFDSAHADRLNHQALDAIAEHPAVIEGLAQAVRTELLPVEEAPKEAPKAEEAPAPEQVVAEADPEDQVSHYFGKKLREVPTEMLDWLRKQQTAAKPAPGSTEDPAVVAALKKVLDNRPPVNKK